MEYQGLTIIKNNGYDEEGEFNIEYALATLLLNDVIVLNSFWKNKHWKTDVYIGKALPISVKCDGVFSYNAKDTELIAYFEIQSLYDHWVKDPIWGPAIFCIKKRKTQPLESVYHKIQNAGIWNLKDMVDFIDYW